MADKIRLSVTEMTASAGVFTKNGNEIESMLRTLTSEKNKLVASWEGDSSKAFSAEFEQFAPQVTQFAKLIEQIGQQLKQAAQTMQETDARVASSLHR
ncbi:WXG100 family type VII secretion target [Clostridium felsineum]|uniref:ESAT-6-like protein n=1 Tax=Clostridium felsineum TaxID=36839 RepID=A0A1S8KZF4_9CLOT|nr:WXG100 family type VII secretion target [Clostridium felsineum]MCR3760838.1 WXG100 family type VII secretion target [Clostridium felsineum]URZ03943.1 ESAT-6-like protein [Clostridium felsineum]URZ07793.1 ESAT-6-like protein [Clostridium felsineum]URZ12824.1 ESAT-6-like protein [Clostridium felsineum]URZ15213.1 ESAT-6-like protein [Clostridium felsineum DSM 794]